MRIDFTGRQTEITPRLRDYTARHLGKLTRLLGDRFEMHVILTTERHRCISEITMKYRDHTLVGVEATSDFPSAIKGALDKLERQAIRLEGRRRTRKRRPRPASAIFLNILGPERLDHQDRRVLETERIAIKPMTLEEAIEALDTKRAGVIVFRNPSTERVNVIYHRPDGHLGLIEPEP